MIKKHFKKILNFQLSTFNSFKGESGQVLIIVLLVLVVAVSIVLSLSARSLTDVRTTTSTEQSNRAYFAAEAGIERALQQIKDTTITANVDIAGQGTPLSNSAKYTGNISVAGGSTNAFGYTGLKDTTVQTNLKPNIAQTTYSAADFGLTSGTLDIYWHVGAATDANKAALEVTVLRVNSAGTYAVDKYGCDPDASRASGNGFSCASPATLTSNLCATPVTLSNQATPVNYCFKVNIPVVGTAGFKAILARIRPLYNNDAIAVKFNGPDSAGNTALPQQGYIIESTGIGPDGATRKLQVFRSFPSLPTVFDFVLYNGSTNTLSKP